ncbi:MAG: hypothetical protein WA989_17160, partial [Henriciella sp.]
MRRTASSAPGCAPEDEFDPLIDDFVTKERNYIHFDLPLSDSDRESDYVQSIDISSHAFWPLLGFTKVERRTKWSRERGRYFEDKPRKIKFGSHTDAAILERYAKKLGSSYERFLDQTTLE